MRPEDTFVEHVKNECLEYGVRFHTSKSKRLRSGGYVSGYFDEDEPELAIALGNPDWLAVLVHEYAHMTQWIEQCDEWGDIRVSGGKNAWFVMEDHFAGRKIKPDILDEAFRIIIRCERDCDQRAVKLIKKFNLPIDTKEYTRQANAYHYFYHGVKKAGKWYGKVPIYYNPKVLSLCPDTFRTQPEKGCPEELLEVILEHIEGKHNISY